VPELIVGSSLLRVCEHTVSFRDFLEFFFRFLFVIGIAVRMVLHSEFAVGALDGLFRRLALNTQNFVVVSLVIQCSTPRNPFPVQSARSVDLHSFFPRLRTSPLGPHCHFDDSRTKQALLQHITPLQFFHDLLVASARLLNCLDRLVVMRVK